MWIIYSLITAVILASRKVQEKNLVWDVWWALGWMIRLGSWLSAWALWLILSRDYSWLFQTELLIILFVVIFIFYPLYTTGYFYALQRMELSLFGMMAPIAIVSNSIFSWIFFEKIPTLFWFLGIFLISLSIMMIFYKNKAKGDVLAIGVAIWTYILLGISSGLDKMAINYISPYLYTTINQLWATISLFMLSFFLFWWPKMSFAQKNWKQLLIIGWVQWIGWSISMLAIWQSPNTSYAVALINTHAIMTLLFGILFLKEKLTKRKMAILWFVILGLLSFALA
jgi:drug/metabolite transporter (DMT)-like permease